MFWEALFSVLSVMWYLTLMFLNILWPFIIAFIILKAVELLFNYLKYNNSKYKDESNNKFFKYYRDTGARGEALTFMILEKLPNYSRILTNVYLPTENGTTEVDLIYITTFGIFVIESKNYSGSIYGNESYKFWTTYINNRKIHFFNPIWQNKKHIEYLEKLIGNMPIMSLIVFSQRCTLRNITCNDNKIKILKRDALKNYLLNFPKRNLLAKEMVDNIYYLLKQYTNVTEEQKQKHI